MPLRWKDLESRGMAPQGAGALPLGNTQRIVPGRIWVEGRETGRPILSWSHAGDLEKGEVPRQLEDDEGVLQAFVALRDAEPEAVLAFARKFGVLQVCRHGLRQGHRFLGAEHDWEQCDPREYTPIATWGWYSRSADALLSVVAEMHRGRAGHGEDWKAVYDWLGAPDAEIHSTPEGGRAMAAAAVNRWFLLGDVRPQLWWPEPKQPPGIILNGADLVASLARQLLFAVTKRGEAKHVYTCFHCRKPFHTPKRRNASRKTFCESLQCQSESKRLAREAYKERQRKQRSA